MKVSSYGASPRIPDLPPSASLMTAPGPAACAACADSGSTITPIAALVAPFRISARSIPVVSESPPAPGLSWVSAMTIGLLARFASSIAWRTPSSGA
jgi:hypothetical protein